MTEAQDNFDSYRDAYRKEIERYIHDLEEFTTDALVETLMGIHLQFVTLHLNSAMRLMGHVHTADCPIEH